MAAAPAEPLKAPAGRRRRVPPLAAAIALIVCCALASLLLDVSMLGLQLSPVARRPSLAEIVDAQELRDAPAWVLAAHPEVPDADLLHLSLLQAACLAHRESVLPWTFGQPGPDQEDADKNLAEHILYHDNPRLLAELRQCPDVDVYLPGSIRGHGYCEDAVAYAKYLKSRVLPRWVMDTEFYDPLLGRNVWYHELCPHTPVILFNHYWDGVPEAPHFPKTKPVYLMPNIEMYELNEQHYWNVDVVLCKTQVCEERLALWYAREGNPRNTSVFFLRHTTTDAAFFAEHTLGKAAIKPKDYANVRIAHVAGGSSQKGTRQVLACWLSRPDFPTLELFIDDVGYQERHSDTHEQVTNASNIVLLNRRMLPLEFGKAIAESSFFLCPSIMEGYGHYINQARAASGVIIATDAAPMNELVEDGVSGVLVSATTYRDSNQFLGGASKKKHALQRVPGMVANVKTEEICRAVERIAFRTSAEQREAMARRAREEYHADTAFFAREMLRLRVFAARHARHQQHQQFAQAVAQANGANLRGGQDLGTT